MIPKCPIMGAYSGDKMKKFLIAAISAFALTASLSACNREEPAPQNTTVVVPADENVTVATS